MSRPSRDEELAVKVREAKLTVRLFMHDPIVVHDTESSFVVTCMDCDLLVGVDSTWPALPTIEGWKETRCPR